MSEPKLLAAGRMRIKARTLYLNAWKVCRCEREHRLS